MFHANASSAHERTFESVGMGKRHRMRRNPENGATDSNPETKRGKLPIVPTACAYVLDMAIMQAMRRPGRRIEPQASARAPLPIVSADGWGLGLGFKGHPSCPGGSRGADDHGPIVAVLIFT